MDLSAIKAQLEEAANDDYRKTLSEVTVERPSDADLFKENESTAAVVEEVIRYDAEAEKARAAYASGTYHAESGSGYARKRRSDAVEAKVVEPKPATSWGFYGSRSTTTSTTVTETALEKERRKAEEQVERMFNETLEDTLQELEDEFDVFSMHAQVAQNQAVKESFGNNRTAYKKQQQSLKRQAIFYRSLLKICKSALKISKKATIYKEGI